jgi:hypothetical protein
LQKIDKIILIIEAMKKIISIFVLLLLSLPVFSQQNMATTTPLTNTSLMAIKQRYQPIQINSNDDYLRKSKSQRNVAWVLLGLGTVCIVAPIISSKNNNHSSDSGLNFDELEEEANSACYVLGGIFIVASGTLFVASHKNKLLAEGKVGFTPLYDMPQLNCSSIKSPVFPSAGVLFHFR